MLAYRISSVSCQYHINLHCALKSYISTEQKAEPWKYHLSPDTQRLYAYPLHSLAYSVLESHKGHPSNYKYTFPPNYVQCITELEACLHETSFAEDHILIFHNFIYPLLSAQPSICEENKWSMVLECWLALYALQKEGNFIHATELTGILAKMLYSCRAATLYHGYLHRTDFQDGSLYLCVTAASIIICGHF